MADRQTLWRMMMKMVARKHGFDLTLMPKPYSNRTGTGAHFNSFQKLLGTYNSITFAMTTSCSRSPSRG